MAKAKTVGKAWTEREDDILRTYQERKTRSCKIAWAVLLPLLPGRTKRAINQRVSRLGVARLRQWTPNEDATLKLEWGVVGVRSLMAKFPRRTWPAIFQRATFTLRLPFSVQGWISLESGAQRSGLDRQTFAKILCAYEVPTWANPVPQRIGRGAMTLIEWDAAEVAVLAYLRAETAEGASLRIGVCPRAMRKAAHAAGHGGTRKAHIRLPPETWDALAAPLLARRKVARCGRVVQEAAPRTSAETTTTCATPPSCSPVTRTKSPRHATVNRTGVLPAGTMTTVLFATATSAVTTSLPP